MGNRNKERRVIFMTAIEVLISVAFTAFGAFMLVSGITTVMRCKSKTIGRITGIHESEGRDRDGILTRYYSPEFEYEVNGQIYHGIGDTSYERTKKIKIGGSIKVFYNPKNPEEHFTKGGGILLTISAAFMLLIGVSGVLMFLSSLKA